MASDLAMFLDILDQRPSWSASTREFRCAKVSQGNDCTLRLTYRPTTAERGNVPLGCGFRDTANRPRTCGFLIAYDAQ